MTDEPPVELHDANDEHAGLRAQLYRLKMEHRDLDHAITALEAAHADQLRLTRLKRQKLRLREEIQGLEDRLLPDIIA